MFVFIINNYGNAYLYAVFYKIDYMYNGTFLIGFVVMSTTIYVQ